MYYDPEFPERRNPLMNGAFGVRMGVTLSREHIMMSRNPLMNGAFGVRIHRCPLQTSRMGPSQSPNERGVRCEKAILVLKIVGGNVSQSPNERGVRCEHKV